MQWANSLSGMGYDLHITRAELWFDIDQCPISQAEWLALVDSRDDLVSVGKVFALRLPGGVETLMWWRAGQIAVNEPFGLDEAVNELVTDALVSLAADANARLQGDDGETHQLRVGRESA